MSFCRSWIFPTFVGTAGENLHAGGGTRWYMDLFTSQIKILFDWPETLTLSCEQLKLGCDWLSWVANYHGNYYNNNK